MKYCKIRKKFVPTQTEILKRVRRLWVEKRDAIPPGYSNDNWHYFNGGVNALTDLLNRIVKGDDVKNA